MPLVQVPNNVQPRQIEFGDDVERSKPGALYFVPGTMKKITQDELQWIQKRHKRFAALLTVIQKEDKQSRLEKERAAKAPKETAKKRPKDNKSKAKQRAEKLLKDAKAKGSKKPVAPAPPPPGPPPASASSDDDDKKKKGNKNK